MNIGFNKDTLIKALLLIIIILIGVIAAPYFILHTSTAQQTDMPPGMVMKNFELGSSTANMSGMNMSSSGGQMSGMSTPIPTISFTITKDTLDGWDLHVITTNFTWTPEKINQSPIADQGHAHLYIDGKLTVLLGPWYHIDSSAMPPGTHIITVSLNANDHSVFTNNGQHIQATQTLVVSPL